MGCSGLSFFASSLLIRYWLSGIKLEYLSGAQFPRRVEFLDVAHESRWRRRAISGEIEFPLYWAVVPVVDDESGFASSFFGLDCYIL